MERALGVVWNIKTDTFGFKISLKDKPATKRCMLSELSSLYDPLALASQFILKDRRIMQKLCQGNTRWNDTVSGEVQKEWKMERQTTSSRRNSNSKMHQA